MMATAFRLPAIQRRPQLLWLAGLASLFLFAPAHAQSLGDIARQERERKQSEAPRETHVYDNEDLKRAKILLPEDKDRVQAAKPKPTPAPATGDAAKPAEAAVAVEVAKPVAIAKPVEIARPAEEAVVSEPRSGEEPLGDVARRYRAMKAQAHEQQAQPKAEGAQVASVATSPLASQAPTSTGGEPGTGEEPLGDVARRYRAMQMQAETSERTPAPSPVQNSQRGLEPKVAERSERIAPAAVAPVPTYTYSLPPVRALASPAADREPARIPVVPPATETDGGRKAIVAVGTFSGRGVRVQAGDTLWALAAKYLGHGREWSALASVNPEVGNPARLRVGIWVRLPDEALRVRSGDSPPADQAGLPGSPAAGQTLRRVQVEQGDSLWKLARAELGEGGAWRCLARANPQVANAELIFPGQMIVVPESCGAGLN